MLGVRGVSRPGHGFHDLNEQRADITFGYVPRADAVIFLLDAGQALKDSEREFLASHVLEGSRDRLVFVLGKVDLLGPGERTAVESYVRKGRAKLVQDPVLYPLSARLFLEGKKEDSGFAPLLEYLAGFLEKDRARVISGLRELATRDDELAPTHGILGPMTVAEWRIWAWRHTDYHLRQFGR